jgi:quercetin 2,3-dioxygenase
MISLFPGNGRGYADRGWLRSHHSFSFADFVDPKRMGFCNLRVINEDRIAPGTGFGTHSHRDMEIVSIVLDGALSHQDSMGNGAVIRPGEVQRMSAGRGVSHSEFNPQDDRPTHFLQIWIEPDERGIEPGYEQKAFDTAAASGQLLLVASRGGRDGSVTLHADAAMHRGRFDGPASASMDVAPGRRAYVHVVGGEIDVNGQRLRAGDALGISDEPRVELSGGIDADVLVFDLR